MDFYTGAKAILGAKLNVAEFVESIGQANWEHAFVSCGLLASMIANHRDGLSALAVRKAFRKNTGAAEALKQWNEELASNAKPFR